MSRENKPLLNFGVIGCGRISGRHLAALASGRLPARLVAVADADAKKAQAQGARYGVPHYGDYHEMLERHPDLHVLLVLTPTGFHAEHVVDLAPYGKHIVVEKPMALRVEECDRMIAACRASGSRLFVVQQNRFNRAVMAARRALEEGRFGRMVMGTVRVRWRRDQPYYDSAPWRGTWALDGGVMAQQASHHVDLLQWFMGPIHGLQCQAATRLLDIEAEDTAVAIMRFASGALGVFEATVAARPENLGASLSLLGERGSVIIGGAAVNRIEYWRFEDERPGDAALREGPCEDIPREEGGSHLAYLRNVAEAILDGKPALVEAEEGKKNVQILTALYESAARDGATVRPGEPVERSRLGVG